MARQIRKDMDTLLAEVEEAKRRVEQKKDQEKDLIYDFLTKELDNENLDFETFKGCYDAIMKTYNSYNEEMIEKIDEEEFNSRYDKEYV